MRLLALFLLFPTLVFADPAIWSREFPLTDFNRTTVDFTEIQSGGPPRDGIPALSDPTFTRSVGRLKPDEGVVTLEMQGAAPRAYPIRYLMWHEIVNDRVGGVPVAITYCPLCNSFLAFERRAAGQDLTFGVSGRLRHSDMVMYDRETESWWQQATGEGIVGRHMGVRLTKLPVWMEPLSTYRARHPDGLIMSQPDHRRRYGANPYEGYDTLPWPFLYRGEAPPHGIAPLARVVRVGDRAWPLMRLREMGQITEAGFALSWQAGLSSALDGARISGGRDIGAVRVRDGAGRDVVHDVMFAFAFHAFHPNGRWMLNRP